MDEISLVDYKILKYISCHQPISFEKINKRYKNTSWERLDKLIDMGLIFHAHYTGLATTEYQVVFTLTINGKLLVEDYKAQTNRTRLMRLIDFILGIVTGVVLAIVTQWLLQSL